MTKNEYKELLDKMDKDLVELKLAISANDSVLIEKITKRFDKRFRKGRKFEVSLDRETFNEYKEFVA